MCSSDLHMIHLYNSSVPTDLFLFSLLTVAAGFGLTKADLFSTEAARGVAQVVLVRG